MSPLDSASSGSVGVLVPGVSVSEGYVIAGRCERCHVTAYPAPAQCPSCWGALSEMRLSCTGVLYSYSTVYAAPDGRPVPYTVGYIDLPEGARVFAHLDVPDDASLRPDQPVELALRPCGADYRALWQPTDSKDARADA